MPPSWLGPYYGQRRCPGIEGGLLRASPSGSAPAAYWPALDGLRGIAVLAVVLFHLHAPGGANGYVGVDAFFALSGFLITSLLLSERAKTGWISLPRFYARRGLRLLPALIATVTLACLAGVLTGTLAKVGPGALAALFYVANWWIYLGGAAPLMEHTWTLAIEEHFYLVWPLLVLALTSRVRRLRNLGVAAACVLVLVALVPWPSGIEPVKLSYLRGAPIVWGSVLAVFLTRAPAVKWVRAVALAGPIALVLLVALITGVVPFPKSGLEGVTSVPGALSIIIVALIVTRPAARTVTVLGATPLRWVGVRAYGIYLYHFPIASLLLNHLGGRLPSWAVIVVGIGASLVVAALSYQFLERPFLRLKSHFQARIATGPPAVATGHDTDLPGNPGTRLARPATGEPA